MRSSNVILIIVAVVFPPAVAAMISGCSCDLFLSILLSLFGYWPGILHAFWLIHIKITAEEERDAQIESGHPRSHAYTPLPSQEPLVGPSQPAAHSQEPSGPPPSYGATISADKNADKKP
ncbi:hypothetical protein DL96DRAFT_1814146 [Flagelloscypha sp. PMI_526]|nr:hypothetical protein DL96DRAFT_1814146 [Flagelloscypha sp. PMI_526]